MSLNLLCILVKSPSSSMHMVVNCSAPSEGGSWNSFYTSAYSYSVDCGHAWSIVRPGSLARSLLLHMQEGRCPLLFLTILFTVSWVKLTRRSTLAISTCGTTTSSFSSSKNLSTMSSRITTTSLLSSGKGSGLASSISPVPGFSATTTSYSASSKILSSSSFPSTIGYSSWIAS